MSKLRIMSNNIWRYDENNDAWRAMGADCSAEVRIPNLFRVYSEKKPDLIGIQECSPHMADLLMRQFSAEKLPYALLWGKDTPIIYRTDKFEVVHTEFLIYPEDMPGYDGCFNNSLTKSYCIAVLRIKENGKTLIFATTHLWWKSSDPSVKDYQPHSDEARAYQVNLLVDRLDELQVQYDCPAIMVGDMNAEYTSHAIQAALHRGFTHGHDMAAEYRDETMGMHYCYPDRFDTVPYPFGFEKSIDHILLRGAPENCVKRFERYAPDYYMPVSDHFPVWIDAEF